VRKVLRAVAGLLLLIVVLALYVFATAGRNLIAARSALSLSVEGVDEASAIEAETHLIQASRQLESIPARLLGLVPIARQNLEALKRASDAAVPTVGAAIDLQHAFARLEDEGLVEAAKVNTSLLSDLQEPVVSETEALEILVQEIERGLSGWLLPPVWERLHELHGTATELLSSVDAAARVLSDSEAMLGGDAPRTYLVLLMNNAELRGAGGILTGVGTVHFDRGRISLGRFRSVHDLREKPYVAVPAPPEFVRRFGTYKADTTLWLNATFSPHVPDVSLVAARLYERTTGVTTDGALLMDPRGLAALVDPDDTFAVPGLDKRIAGSEIADFTYSDVYERFDDQIARRAALLDLGEGAFKSFIASPLVGRERVSAIGRAVAGGHIRMNSFDAAEAAALDELGLSGSIVPPDDTRVVRVTQQNFGSANGEGTKLDFWTDRKLDQACTVGLDRARCRTRFTLTNEIPDDLPLYVAGDPYGILRSNIEIYLPSDAALSEAALDGRRAEIRTEGQSGYQVVSVYVELGAGGMAELDLTYTMPIDGAFHLRLEPQPLATDLDLDLAVVAPPGWTVEDQGRAFDREVRWDRPVDLRLAPDPRTGLAAAWARLFGGT